MNLHQEVTKDYTKKYERYRIDGDENSSKDVKSSNEEAVVKPIKEKDLFNELKAYRLNKSRKESIKPYYIYSNKQ